MSGGMGRLQYYKLYADVEDLKFSTKGSACFDLRAYLKDWDIIKARDNEFSGAKDGVFRISPGARALVPTGMVFDIPDGHSVRIHPRSGVSFDRGLSLSNCEGIVDSDYVEEVYISVVNYSNTPLEIAHNERIAQAELVRNNYYIFKELDERPEKKSERSGGFGSTGKDELNKSRLELQEEFLLGVDPAYHEYRGPITQEDY
jgi:dUTP pyrophosphatase